MHVGKQHDRALPDVAVEAGLGKLLTCDGISFAQQVKTFLGDFADDADAETRTREWLTPDNLIRQTEFGANGAHLILEQGAQRLDELEFDVLRQAAHCGAI